MTPAEPGPALDERCGRCGAQGRCEAGQVLLGERLQWHVWCECPNCGPMEVFGWDEPPPEVRAAILRDQGEARLTLDRFEAGFRLPLLRVFRESGNSLDDARRRVEEFVADGIVGTGPEMALYALRMRKHGLPVTVDPDGPVI